MDRLTLVHLPGGPRVLDVLTITGIVAEAAQGDVDAVAEVGGEVGEELVIPVAGHPAEGEVEEVSLLDADIHPGDRHGLHALSSGDDQALIATDDHALLLAG